MASREPRDLAALKRGVRTSLPEVDLIEETTLREQVVDLHAVALSETTFARIEDIPASGVPESPLMTCGTQADHYRGVALIAIGMLDGMRRAIPALSVDRDILLAGALVHDVGKAYEFANWDRWKAERSHSGSPALRHPVYGAHLALRMGLPEPVVHCIAAHSYLAEGQFVEASVETTLVQYADIAFWKLMEAAGLLDDSAGD